MKLNGPSECRWRHITNQTRGNRRDTRWQPHILRAPQDRHPLRTPPRLLQPAANRRSLRTTQAFRYPTARSPDPALVDSRLLWQPTPTLSLAHSAAKRHCQSGFWPTRALLPARQVPPDWPFAFYRFAPFSPPHHRFGLCARWLLTGCAMSLRSAKNNR